MIFIVLAAGAMPAILHHCPGQQSRWDAGVMQCVREKHSLCIHGESNFILSCFGISCSLKSFMQKNTELLFICGNRPHWIFV